MKRLGILLGIALLACGLVLAFEEVIYYEVWEVDPDDGAVTMVDCGWRPYPAGCPDGCTTLGCCSTQSGDCMGACHIIWPTQSEQRTACQGGCIEAQSHCNDVVESGGCALVGMSL